LRGVH